MHTFRRLLQFTHGFFDFSADFDAFIHWFFDGAPQHDCKKCILSEGCFDFTLCFMCWSFSRLIYAISELTICTLCFIFWIPWSPGPLLPWPLCPTTTEAHPTTHNPRPTTKHGGGICVSNWIIILRSWAEPPDHTDEQRARTAQDDEEQEDNADNLNRT